MLPPALIYLLRLQALGFVRRLWRAVKRPKGAIFFIFGVLFFILWLGGSIATARMQPTDLESVRVVAPLMLLGVCLLTAVTSAGDKAVAFTPGEVDFLFPGPFTRRQLLLFKLTKSTAAALATSVMLASALLRYSRFWVAGFIGIFLSLLLMQLFSMALVMAAQTLGEKAWSRGRKYVLIGVALAAFLGLRGVLSRYPLSGPNRVDIVVVLQGFAASDTGKILLWPFRLFANTITAETLWPDLPKWAAQAALIDLLLLAVVIKLDAAYLEAASGATQRRYERLRRFRSGSALAATASGTARRMLPRLPFLGGAGPIAWRQFTNAARSAKGLLFTILLLCLGLGPFFVAARSSHAPGDKIVAGIFLTMGWMSVMMAGLFKFDFRSDLDAMDALKALPLRPIAIAIGQVVTPVLVLTVIHWVLLGTVISAFDLRPSQMTSVWIGVVAAMPFNLLLFSAENLVFLLAPSRPAASGPGDFQLLGRQMFVLIARSIVVGIGVAIAIIIGAVAFYFADQSIIALGLTASVVLLAEGLAMLPFLAIAFGRFDPSVQTPPG